jgi:hypothetical protein
LGGRQGRPSRNKPSEVPASEPKFCTARKCSDKRGRMVLVIQAVRLRVE